MRKIVLLWLGVWVCSSVSYAVWDYTIGDGQYEGFLKLEGQESLLMTGGGGDQIVAFDASYVEIQNTAPYQPNVGGVHKLNLDDSSSLIVAGGEIVGIGIYDDATAVLRGGQIHYLHSYQYVWWGNNYVPHIEVVCDVDSVNHNTTTNVLTGNWLDGSSFNIQLRNQTGYDPAIENIFFTPEPTTLLLFGLGGLGVHRFGKRNQLK